MKDNNDWYDRDFEDDFGDALHRRTEELYNIQDAELDDDGLIECPVLPLRDMVVFPHMISPVFLATDLAMLSVEEAQLTELTVIGLTQRDSDLENPAPAIFTPSG